MPAPIVSNSSPIIHLAKSKMLDALRNTGFWLSARLTDRLLREVGEKP